MKKQFLFNILLLVILNALIKPFWVFGIDRTVQNVVGSQSYGLYFALFNFSLLFNAFLDMGLSNFNSRKIAQNPTLFHNYFPGITALKLLLGLLYMIISLGGAYVLGYSSNAFKLLFILAVNQFLASFLLFIRSNISGLQMYNTDSFLSVTDRFLMIVLCSLLLWTNFFPFEINIWSFAFSQTVAYVLACCIAFAIVIIKTGKLKFKKLTLSGGLLKKSWPFALLSLLMVIYNRADAILIERLLPNGAMAAGSYAQSYRIFDAINMVSVLFASLLLPMFARMLSEKKDFKPLIRLSFSLLFPGTIISATILSYFAWPFLDLLYRENHPNTLVFVLLITSIVPVSLTYIFGTLLTADGRLSALNTISGAALLLNVLLNLLLIHRFNITGAAFAALISHLFVATSQIIICKKKYSLNVSWIRLLPFVLLFFSSILFSFAFDHFKINVIWKISLSGVFAAGVVILLKIVDIQDIYKTFKSETLS